MLISISDRRSRGVFDFGGAVDFLGAELEELCRALCVDGIGDERCNSAVNLGFSGGLHLPERNGRLGFFFLGGGILHVELLRWVTQFVCLFEDPIKGKSCSLEVFASFEIFARVFGPGLSFERNCPAFAGNQSLVGEMFGSGSESGHGSSSGGGGGVSTRFVWPYGGRRVLLIGSFTRWIEQIPMSPIEGCPTVFQVVWNIPPGYHQYKFYVDGEWRHDEHQPFVNSNYGVVNTIFLAGDVVTVPSTSFSPEASGNMDVDNDPYMRAEVPGVSASDIEVSRQRISIFLSNHTAYDLLPESGKVVALDVNLPVKRAFHILYEQGIPLAPLWDFYIGQFVGVLTALDFILILRELGNHGSNLTEEELETHTIAAWKAGKSQLSRQINCNEISHPRRLIHGGPYESLKDVALKILQNKVATIPIIHSSSQSGSFPQLLHLASLSGILKCICRHFRHCSSALPILQQPICAIPLGTWVPEIGVSSARPLAMLRPNSSLNAALSVLVQAEVSSVPIVDDHDSLLDIYSRSDITALAKDKAYSRFSLDEISIHQALQLGQDANSPHGIFNGQRCQMCLRSDSLHKVMERLANPGVRRVVIVEAGSNRVEGIISLSDVFRFLLG